MEEIVSLEPVDVNGDINSIRHLDANSIGRIDVLGVLNFLDMIPRLQMLVALYRRITPETWQKLPPDLQTQIRTLASGAWALVGQIRNFSPNQQNPKQERDSLVSQLSSNISTSFQQLAWFSLFESENEKKRQIDSLTAEAQNVSETIKSLQREGETALSVAREAAAQTGVNAQVAHFGAAADNDEKLAQSWFIWLCWAAGLVAALAILFVILAYKDIGASSTPAAIQFATSKIILFAIASYSVLLCARQYSAAKHNATVNRHKQLALRTFESFVSGSKGDDVRDAVLLKAATAVFEHQDTGYLKQSLGQTGSLQNVVELFTARPAP